jgi:hypothetical protein
MIDIQEVRKEVYTNLVALEQERLQQQKDFGQLRQHYARILSLVLLLLFGTLMLGINSGIVEIGMLGPFMLMAILVTVIMVGYYYRKTGKIKEAFKNRVKETVYRQVIARWYPQLTYYPQQFMAESTYKAANFFGTYDIYKGDDYLVGQLSNGQEISFSELDVKSDGGDNGEFTVFKGLFFAVELTNNIATTIRILPDSAEKGMGKLGVFLQEKLGKLRHKGSQLVYFEEFPIFEKAFVVYSQDETIARQFVTHSLVKVLMKLLSLTESIALSFSEKQLYVAVSSKQAFLEVDLKHPLNSDKLWNQLVEDLNYSLQLVQGLEQLSNSTTNNKGTAAQKVAIPTSIQKKPSKGSVSYNKSKSKDNPFLL